MIRHLTASKNEATWSNLALWVEYPVVGEFSRPITYKSSLDAYSVWSTLIQSSHSAAVGNMRVFGKEGFGKARALRSPVSYTQALFIVNFAGEVCDFVINRFDL